MEITSLQVGLKLRNDSVAETALSTTFCNLPNVSCGEDMLTVPLILGFTLENPKYF